MASPFKVFRKHQKAWLAVLGISTMFAFIVLPNVMQNMGGRGPRTDLAVITSKYGDLTGRELQSLRLRNRHLGEFLISLRKAVQDSMPDTENSVDLPGLYEDWRNGVNIAGRAEKVDLETLFKYWSVADPMIRGASDGGASEEITVDIWLRAHRAEELGLVVSDQMVFDFLGGFTAGRVQPDVIERLHKKAELSESQLFEAIRSQLLADKLQQMFLTTLGPITPAQRWDYYRRLHRIVTAEVTAIPVNDFVDEVNGWSDEELEDFCSQRQDELAEFFARHKYQIDNPHRPEPGFKQPHRIDVEYVVARHEDFEPYVDVDKFDRSTLSDDEKFQHYIEMMQKSPSLGMPPDTTSPTGDQPDTGEPATPETPEAKPADTGEPATPETPEAKPADTGEPATQESTSPEAEPTGESTDSTPTPPTPKADDGKASDNDTDDPATGETSLTKPSPFQWVSFQQEEGEAAGEPAEAETPEAENAEPSVTPTPEQPGETTPPAAETTPPAGETTPPAAETTPPAGETTPPTGETTPPTGETTPPDGEIIPPVGEPIPPAAETTPPDTTPKQPLPGFESMPKMLSFEESTEILASKRATEAKLEEVLAGVLSTMSAHYRNSDRPAKPDLSAAVEAARKKAVEEAIEAAVEGDDPEKQIRLEIFRTGTMSAQDLVDLLQEPEPIDEDPDKQRIAQRQIGKTTIKQRKNRSPFLRVAFSGQTIQLFDPQMAFDSEGNGYLFWKVHEREEYVPEDPDFKGENEEEKTEEQVKEQRLLWRKVAAKWQMVNDRQRALDEAKALAAGVENADKPLAELLGGDRKVLETAGFSWLTEGRITGQSPVRPIVFSRVMLREEDEEGKPLLDKEGKQLEVDLEAGEEFLRVASGLEVGGKLGVAMDNPQKHAYIIRLTDAPSDEQLWETCLNDNGKSQNNERIPPDYERVGQTVGWQRYGEWRAKIQESAQLEWKRPPDPSGGFR